MSKKISLHRTKGVPQQFSESKKGTETLKRITVDIPEILHKKLKLRALEADTTMSNLIRDWLSRHLK
jgi:hypothetical protein